MDIHPAAHDAVGALFFELGCSGVVSEGPEDRIIKAYLPFREDVEALRRPIESRLRIVQEHFPDIQAPVLSMRIIKGEDWSVAWRRFFKREQPTSRLVVVPAWEPAPPSWTGDVILMDPGPAFGTGKHPTTRMCLRAMENTPAAGDWSMIDVGTGSGILAMYGVKLGARRVLGTDVDPDALAWAGKNLALNRLSGCVELSGAPLDEVEEVFDLAVGNLILEEILNLMDDLCRVTAPGGRLLLSGILEDQVDRVRGALGRSGLIERECLQEEEWVCIASERPKEGTDRGMP